MPKFKVTVKVLEEQAYSTIVVAESAEAAVKSIERRDKWPTDDWDNFEYNSDTYIDGVERVKE